MHIVGARPNFVKLAPVYHALREQWPDGRQVLVHTGQHYDDLLSRVFIDDLGLPEPDHFLSVGSGSHGMQTGRALERVEDVLLQEKPHVVVVAGDVNSTLAGALAAAKLGIPVAHIEAGLRSFDRTMPEEINRVLVDQISRWCFTHSPEADGNLRREGIEEERICFVGNTMIDSLVRLRPKIASSGVHDRLGVEPGSYLLVTLHRPTLVDSPEFGRALEALQHVSVELPVVFPLHPRSRACMPFQPKTGKRLLLIDPVGYLDFLALELHAAAVLTDSGGVQEETTYLRVPCFTLRANTERPVTIEKGTNRLLGLNVDRIADVPTLLRDSPVPIEPPNGWDGHAAERVARRFANDVELGGLYACAESAAL